MSRGTASGAAGPSPAAGAEAASRALPGELREFLVELAIALQKHGIYPAGHPSLGPAAQAVTRRLAGLLRERPEVGVGVARHQLVVAGVATDPRHPMLRELAGRLHRHMLGALTFRRGVTAEELGGVLRVVACGGDPPREPLGLTPERLQAWPHVMLHPVSYERLDLADEGAAPEGGADASRATRLWLDLARVAVAAAELAEAPPDSERVARAINEHPGAAAYDQAVIGHLLQIAEELKTAQGAEGAALRGRVGRLVTRLSPETLRRLLEMGGDAAQRRKFLLDSADGMTADAVLKLVEAAGQASRQTISDSMLRLLSKLATSADRGPAAARITADAAVRSQVKRLVQDWTLEDPNPEAYTAGLERIARAVPEDEANAVGAVVSPEPLRIVQMSLEIDAAGPALWDAVARLVTGAELGSLLDLLERAPAENRVAEEIWREVATPEQVRILLEGDPFDFSLIDRLLTRLERGAADVMLDALAESQSRATRRALMDRLAALGGEIAPLVVARLDDDRWYVRRNLLALLDRLGRWPDTFSPVPHWEHPDPRVRREALKLLLKMPAERDRALTAALAETDERILPIALAAAQRGCPPAAVPLVLSRLRDAGLALELRAAAVRALRSVKAAEALDALLDLASRGTSLFGRVRLAPKSPEMVAALVTLAEAWRHDERAAAVLARAAASRDKEMRAAAEKGGERR